MKLILSCPQVRSSDVEADHFEGLRWVEGSSGGFFAIFCVPESAITLRNQGHRETDPWNQIETETCGYLAKGILPVGLLLLLLLFLVIGGREANLRKWGDQPVLATISHPWWLTWWGR